MPQESGAYEGRYIAGQGDAPSEPGMYEVWFTTDQDDDPATTEKGNASLEIGRRCRTSRIDAILHFT